MKNLKAKVILSVVTALLLMAALAVVYGNIGLSSDIAEAQKHCKQKMNSLAASVSQLVDSYMLVNYDYDDILQTIAHLSALPLKDVARQEGDAAIRMYKTGCIVRIDGDDLIAPKDIDFPQFDVSDFRGSHGEQLESGFFQKKRAAPTDADAPAGDETPGNDALVCTFFRLHEDYYYVDFSSEKALSDFMDARIRFSDTMTNLEKIYGGHIITFDDSDENHPLITKPQNLDSTCMTLRDLGIDETSGNQNGIIQLNGESCVYALSERIQNSESEILSHERIALIIPIEDLSVRRIPRLVMVLCITLLFFVTAICWVLSSIQLLRRPAITAQQRIQYSADRIRRILIAIGIAGMLSVGLTTFFVNCLMQLYTATQNNLNLLDRIDAVASETQTNAERAREEQAQVYVNYARRIADLLAEYPHLKTSDSLENMCALVGADYLMLYDDHGRELLSNAPYVNLAFSRDSQDPSYEFRRLLSGVPSIVQDIGVDEQTRLERQLIGVSMNDGDISDGYGALIMAMPPDKQFDDMMSLDQLMQTMTPSDCLCLALNPDSGEILHSSDPDLIGENALNLGMTERDLQGGIMDHFSLNGLRWYSSTDSNDDLLYHSAVQANSIYRRLPVTALSFCGCFLAAYALLVLVLMMGYTERNISKNGPLVVDDDEALAKIMNPSQEDPNSRIAIVIDHLRANHFGYTPERKTRFVFSLAAGLMLAGVLAALQFSANGHERFFILYYVLYGKWTPGVNLFAIAKIILISLITIVALLALRLVTGVISSLLQKRGETVCRLISSFIQYVSILALVFAAFDCLGFDTRALLASVGILSLALSLGAKDLVADVLSGITIAFSDEYQIGDYIEIDKFRGWVLDIGVRVTTLVNNDGNIKHFSNRDVKNILNLSRRNCCYTISVTIANDQPLRKVEEILNRELPHISENTPEIIKGPEYRGVTGFFAGGVTLAITAECKEQNYGKVRNKINRSIRLILEENGIVIK